MQHVFIREQEKDDDHKIILDSSVILFENNFCQVEGCWCTWVTSLN